MKVNTYLRPAKDGRSHIYLDYYVNGNRMRKKTGLFIYDKPKTKSEKDHNKENNIMIETMKAELTLKIQRNEIGFETNKKKESDFIKYVKRIVDEREKRETNYDGWRSAYKHLSEFSPNGLHFNQLNVDYLEDFKQYLLKDLKGTSAQRYFNLIKHAVHDAFRDRLIKYDYAYNVESPKSEEPIKQYLTDKELFLLYNSECKSPILKKAFLFSCLTGMAYADIMKIHWNNLSKDNDGKWQIIFHRKKTKGLQYHQISEEAIELLGEIQKNDEKVFKSLRYNSWMNVILRDWVYGAGIKKVITFHCARHTYATILLNKGVSLSVVQELLGHQDIKTTRGYAKVMDSNKRTASEMITLKPKNEEK
ncbi:MAG TPA: site-specific integrase [Bacteroidales bacterium]|mgnify:CR=1 FL=1|nr:site-specific integrase [Bacteroidales bacterium]